MRITVFNGSPRGEDGNTHWMVREFLKGAEEAGAEVENVFLREYDLRLCTGCFGCWGKTPGKCVMTDDGQELVGKIPDSDVVVFATPLYVDNVTGLMKVFMDRMIMLGEPRFEDDGHGESSHPARYPNPPKVMAISNSGYPEESQFQVLRLLFQRVARNFHSELVGEIYRGAGELFKSENMLLKPILARYRSRLQAAGKELVDTGRLSEATMSLLAEPLVPNKRYLRGANKYWDKVLGELE